MKKFVDVALLGAGGAGKGTQAKNIIRAANEELQSILCNFSTGDEFRKAKKNEKLMEKGLRAPDDDAIELFNRLATSHKRQAADGAIWDGFPRSDFQLDHYKQYQEENGIISVGAILLDAEPEVIFDRLEKRKILENRADDTPDAIAKRIAGFREWGLPIAEDFAREGQLITIKQEKVNETEQEIWARLWPELEPRLHVCFAKAENSRILKPYYSFAGQTAPTVGKCSNDSNLQSIRT